MNLDALIPDAPGDQTQHVFATVTQASPLRIKLDGDSSALPITPVAMVAPALNDRVLVMVNGKQLIVTGIVGGGVPVSTDLGTTDLNSITTTGTYFQATNANATSGRHYPITYSGLLEVAKFATIYIQQRYTTYMVGSTDANASKTFARTYYNGTWGAWREYVFADTNVAHARFVTDTSPSVPGVTWTTVPFGHIADASPSAPFTLAANAVTLTQAGVYAFSSCVTTTTQTFCLRIKVGSTVIAQNSTGQAASSTSNIAENARVSAGAVVTVDLYSNGASQIQPDGTIGPSSLTITRLGN